jgi:3-isopropylmalate dehydrogenase
MATYKIAVLPGDGIGEEVTPQAQRILQLVGRAAGIGFEFETALIGGCAIDVAGQPLPPATLSLCQAAHAILFGAVGGPKWDHLPQEQRPERGLLGIRKELDLFANLRPAKCFPMLVDASPLKRSVVEGTDLMVIRELTGGLYFGEPRGREEFADGGARAVNTMAYTSREIERVARAAFEVAMKRKKRLASVDKANVLVVSQLWREVVTRVAKDYPQVTLEHVLVDNCAMALVHKPTHFDTIVTENTFGDILSDEAAILAGSMGMLPSASLGGAGGRKGPSTAPRPTSPGRGWPIRSRRSCRRPCCCATRSSAAPTRTVWTRRCCGCSSRAIAPGTSIRPAPSWWGRSRWATWWRLKSRSRIRSNR